MVPYPLHDHEYSVFVQILRDLRLELGSRRSSSLNVCMWINRSLARLSGENGAWMSQSCGVSAWR